MPTPVPEAIAIISVWIGNASDTAVRASSFSCATNMLSTILYSACTNMEIIMGKDMLISSFGTGMVPILFPPAAGSFVCCSDISLPPAKAIIALKDLYCNGLHMDLWCDI